MAALTGGVTRPAGQGVAREAHRRLLLDSGSRGTVERDLIRVGLCMDSAYTEHVRPLSCGRPSSNRLEVVPNQPPEQLIAGVNETDYPFGATPASRAE
jgi:hypothetical protein